MPAETPPRGVPGAGTPQLLSGAAVAELMGIDPTTAARSGPGWRLTVAEVAAGMRVSLAVVRRAAGGSRRFAATALDHRLRVAALVFRADFQPGLLYPGMPPSAWPEPAAFRAPPAAVQPASRPGLWARLRSARPGEIVVALFYRVLLVVIAFVAVLPFLALFRGAADFSRTGPADLAQAIGVPLALLALTMGSVFFLYSMKYYVSTAVVLLSAVSPSTNGNGTGNEQTKRNGHPHGLSRFVRRRANGNGDGNGNGNGHHLDIGYEPYVSIHIATYNEKRVIGRLLEVCAALDYNNYEVVLVDDSNDETATILEAWKGHPRFKIVHRSKRDGFKGGALQVALLHTDPRAEFVIVWDADALPFADSIQTFLPHFFKTDRNGNGGSMHKPAQPRPEVAAVQSYQWHVLNKSESWLTEAVRAEYAGSYMIERPFQEAARSMKMIAGTAYMVRAHLLRELGWGQSLTEDWELTLRLYARGFKVVYTPYAETPAECVATYSRLARQRMRWAEGHCYNVRRRFGEILRSPHIGFVEKVEFLFYAAYYLQAVLLIAGSASWFIAEVFLHAHVPEWTALLGWSLLFSNLVSLPLMNLAGLLLEDAPPKDLVGVLGALATSYLLVPFQAWAALKGFLESDEGPWYRTPKTGRITDPVQHLRRLKWLGRWLRRRSSPPRGAPHAIVTPDPRPRHSRRLGWIVSLAMALALAGIGYDAAHAPVVYANPDQLFLRSNTSPVNAADQTLDVQGTVGTSQTFGTGSTFTWITQTTYPGGSVAAGNYTFKLDWANNGCRASPDNCAITVTWGFCSGTCTTLQPPAATLNFNLTDADPVMGTNSLTVAGTAITLSGCPCHFYVGFSVTVPSGSGGRSFDLGYSGNVGTNCTTNTCNDSNITTPVLPATERLLPLLVLGLAIPPLVGWRQLRRRALA